MPRRLNPLALPASLVLMCAVWAAWPLRPSASSISIPPPTVTTSMPPAPLNVAAFRAPLWVAPIPPPAPPAPPPPPPPLKLQLVAISRDAADAALLATIFDPDTNKLIILRQGQAIGSRTIARITPAAIDIKDTAGTRTLSLRTDPASSTRGTP